MSLSYAFNEWNNLETFGIELIAIILLLEIKVLRNYVKEKNNGRTFKTVFFHYLIAE